jgi:hypothetical protein
MFGRCTACVAGIVILALGAASAAQDAGPWQSAEIVTFTDFDNLEVKLDGQKYKAFLVGLRPLRETIQGKDEQDRLRKSVLAKLRKNSLSARVITKRGEVVGLSIDAFGHHKNDFDHPWDPGEYPYCWTGWFAYNFNTYFLYTKTTRFQDNFGDNTLWRDKFAEVACGMQEAERAAALVKDFVKDLGDRRFATREAASKKLKAIGWPAVRPLRKAAASGDLETQRRAEQIIQAIEAGAAPKGQKNQAWAVAGK